MLGPDYPRICFAEAEDAVGGRPPASSPQGLPKLASGSLRDVNEKCLNPTQAGAAALRNGSLSGRVCLRPFAAAVPRRTARAVSPFARRTVFTASQMRGSFRGKTAASGRREGRLSATQELAVSIATSEPSFAPYPLVGAGGSACCGRLRPASIGALTGGQVILGPPGTGKTLVVAEICRRAVATGAAVLVAAPSKAAADVVTLRLIEMGFTTQQASAWNRRASAGLCWHRAAACRAARAAEPAPGR